MQQSNPIIVEHFRDEEGPYWSVTVDETHTWCSYIYPMASFTHYPVPAIPTRVGFRPACEDQPYPSAYWYVSSPYLLWTFWEAWGLVTTERA